MQCATVCTYYADLKIIIFEDAALLCTIPFYYYQCECAVECAVKTFFSTKLKVTLCMFYYIVFGIKTDVFIYIMMKYFAATLFLLVLIC